jgi:hypothetical protein
VTGDTLLGLALAGAFSLLAFTTTGGFHLAPATWSELALLVLAAGLGFALVVSGPRGRVWGVPALGLFAALSALTFASIAWSVQPAASWVEANRTLSYVAAFAAAMALARLAPGRWRALIGGLAVYALVVSVYALLVKVFPGSLDAGNTLGRLRAPFSYDNAVGIAAAIGIPAWLWLGAGSGTRNPWLTGLTVPAVGALVTALILCLGRGAVIAAVVGLALWFAFVPTRLRAALLLAAGSLVGIAVSLWATGDRALMHDYVALPARVSAGHRFAVVLLIALAVLGLAGAGCAVGLARVRLSEPMRRRIGIALIALLALVPVGGIVALASSSRGFGGEVSHLWTSLTSPKSVARETPSRLTTLSSSRPEYWRDGLKVGEHAPLAGTGAFGFATAHLRYSGDNVQQAHSYLVQTFADLGVIGLLVSAGLLAAWVLAVRRTLGWGRRTSGASPPPLDGTEAERSGMVTLLAVALAFGVHSSIDWTWFIPGVAVPALACAGWVAGRGPLDAPAPARLVGWRSPAAQPLRAAGALALVTAAVLAAWIVWQPLRSANADAAAITALEQGDTGAALSRARTAVSADPVDIQPLIELAQIKAALGQLGQARNELTKATSVQPSNPQAWLWLAGFDQAHGRPADALRELHRAWLLEPYSGLSAYTLTQYR